VTVGELLPRITSATPRTTATIPGSASSGGTWCSSTSATSSAPGTSSSTASPTTVGPTLDSTRFSRVWPSSWAQKVIAAISHQSRALNPDSGTLPTAAVSAMTAAQVE
jgi:hypothetical protein